MKPIHIILIVIAGIAFGLSYAVYRKNMAKKVSDDTKKPGTEDVLATNSITVVVDPYTNEEYVISPMGENNIDLGSGTANMNVKISAVLSDIDNRTTLRPDSLVLRTYSAEGKLMGQTKIANPYMQKLPVGDAATAQTSVNGLTDYSCQDGYNLGGPGYFKNEAGSELFGMFCKT